MLSTIVDKGTALDRAAYLRQLSLPITTHLTPDPSSIGIKAVQDLVLALSTSASAPRLIWIEEAQSLTLEASNALLKILEEPPANTTLFLTCPNAAALLPTIRSRCQLFSLRKTNDPLPLTILPSLKPLFAQSSGDRLQHLGTFPSDKTELLAHFADLAREISQTIKTTSSPAGRELLRNLADLVLSTHEAIRSNVNQTLALSHFLLHLPRSK